MKHTEFQRILVANRGEIASRVIRAIHGLGKTALAVYAHDDRELPFVDEADEAYSLGSGDLSATYLHINRIIQIAAENRADAIHPGYGFLAENAEFAVACERSGIHFIGPSSRAISLMGHKSRARDIAAKLEIPVLEGLTGELQTLIDMRDRLPYPLLIKPAAGGGGKGMRIVQSVSAFEKEAREASREALKYFGSEELYVEQYLNTPRHIEVQVIADHHGHRAHLFERECSLQRRYQKIIEEAPSLSISEDTRSHITSAALSLTAELGYTNAGTVEFLMDGQQHFYFMEMNTRIQVEHPVTEMITGVDLVKEQIRIAEGHPLSFSQEEVVMEGHALEARVYAEDPMNGFLPSAGKLGAFDLPREKSIRTDGGYRESNPVEPWYDPMLAKLIVKGKNREDARKQMIRALKQTCISGVDTNRDFLLALLRSAPFRENRIHTGYIDQDIQNLRSSILKHKAKHPRETLLAAAAYIALGKGIKVHNGSPWHRIGHWRIVPGITLELDGESHRIIYRPAPRNEGLWFRIHDREILLTPEHHTGRQFRLRIQDRPLFLWGWTDQSEVILDLDGHQYRFRRLDVPDRRYILREKKQKHHTNGEISAPLSGKIVEIPVREGDRVTAGAPLVVIESMKMENKMLADHEAVVKHIEVTPGQQVRTNQLLLMLGAV